MEQQSESAYKGKGALDAFINLLSLISLGWLAQAFGVVCFQLINKYFGDLTAYYSYGSPYYESALKYGIASLIVIAPVYFGAVNVLHNKYKKNELNHTSGIYRWLTYLMLLVSSLTIVGSLITLINSFLNGNYTVPFILKVATVIAIAGVIFGYYFYDLRRKDYLKKDLVSIIVGSIVGVLTVALVVVGFMSVETPAQSRAKAEDSRTEQALAQLVYSIANSYSGTQKLETSYNLPEMLSGSNLPTDNIIYSKVSETEFQLCTTFLTKITNPYPQDMTIPWFNHGTGYICYTIDAKKEVEKNFKLNYQPTSGETVPVAPATTGTPVKQ